MFGLSPPGDMKKINICVFSQIREQLRLQEVFFEASLSRVSLLVNCGLNEHWAATASGWPSRLSGKMGVEAEQAHTSF